MKSQSYYVLKMFFMYYKRSTKLDYIGFHILYGYDFA